MSTTATLQSPIQTARALRSLYFTRTVFSIIWVTLVALFAETSRGIATILLVIYPAWDVVGTLLDLKANKYAGTNLMPQYVNTAISILTTIAVAIAIQKGVPEALIVFGVWAILTGVIQFALGLKRRIALGGQWPMILSGGQSTLAGVSFIVMAHAPNMGIANLAGYSAFGAFYYLLSAIRLNKTIKKGE